MSTLSFTGIEAYNANQEAADGILTYMLKGDRLEVSDKNSTFKFHVLGTDNLTASDFLF